VLISISTSIVTIAILVLPILENYRGLLAQNMTLRILTDLVTLLTIVVSVIYIIVGSYIMRKRQSRDDGRRLRDRGIAGIIALTGLYILVQLLTGNVSCCRSDPPRL
jgi:hypothetical protein